MTGAIPSTTMIGHGLGSTVKTGAIPSSTTTTGFGLVSIVEQYHPIQQPSMD